MKTVTNEEILNAIDKVMNDGILQDNPFNLTKVTGMCEVALLFVDDKETVDKIQHIQLESMIKAMVVSMKD